jgi:ribosomal protein L25 (general stress protein Ctc)
MSQREEHRTLRKNGAIVEVVFGNDSVNMFVERLLENIKP